MTVHGRAREELSMLLLAAISLGNRDESNKPEEVGSNVSNKEKEVGYKVNRGTK